MVDARLALEGGTPADCDAVAFDEGCFGPAAYLDVQAPDSEVDVIISN
jgi:hypothetical protein